MLCSNKLLAVRFSDRRDLYMLTTTHDESTSSMIAWDKLAEVHKPTCILDYNKYMVGVDKNYQILQPYNVSPHLV